MSIQVDYLISEDIALVDDERYVREELLLRAQAENAKLKELCGDLFKGFECGWPSDVCGDCKRDGMGMPIGGCKLENRAHELGVEVDG